MPLHLATHWGSFHADDVLACTLIRTFRDPAATVVRTRDADRLAQADVVFDVGGTFDEATHRFDHHQHSYQGPLSSAGMVLNWLEREGHVAGSTAARLRRELVDWVDAVDNGRREPIPGVLDYTRMVEAYNKGSVTLADFDAAYERAVTMSLGIVQGIVEAERMEQEAERLVVRAMDAAAEAGSNVLRFDRYLSWKPAYFRNGGAAHPTDFVVFPGIDGAWRAIAIPPEEGSFAQKRSLPEPWAGLRDEELVAVSGVPGARFCHKNRFIAVWDSEANLMAAMERFSMVTAPPVHV